MSKNVQTSIRRHTAGLDRPKLEAKQQFSCKCNAGEKESAIDLFGRRTEAFKHIANSNVAIELAVELDIAEPIRREHERISTACAR